MQHSKLPPSSAARRVACPGSRALEARYPENDSPHAKEGEAAHWLAMFIMQEKPICRWDQNFMFYNDHDDKWDEIFEAPNGEPLTEEMYDGALLYQKAIEKYMTRDACSFPAPAPEPVLHLEERVSIERIHPDCWGTPDAWAHLSDGLHIWDYKFGYLFVEVYENWQLIEYCAGILDEVKARMPNFDDRHLPVHFHIVQPRSFHRDGPVRSWHVMASDLRSHFNILSHAEAEASKDDALCNPTPECTYCRGRHACKAIQRSALSAVETSMMNTPLDLHSYEVGSELRILKRAAKLLDARITGLEQEANSMISRGEFVPYFRLERTKGRERWTMTPEEVAEVGEAYEVDLRKPLTVITPRQAAKLKIPEDVIQEMSERPDGPTKLVEDDGLNAKKIFGAGEYEKSQPI